MKSRTPAAIRFKVFVSLKITFQLDPRKIFANFSSEKIDYDMNAQRKKISDVDIHKKK